MTASRNMPPMGGYDFDHEADPYAQPDYDLFAASPEALDMLDMDRYSRLIHVGGAVIFPDGARTGIVVEPDATEDYDHDSVVSERDALKQAVEHAKGAEGAQDA